jgi:hypothetical protein
MKKQLSLFFLSFFLVASLLAQNCSVSVDSLKGNYTGDCNKGIANGKGIATGTDSYTGYFKNGYPDGEGKYVWKNGNTYEGSWKNGLFEGEGTLRKINFDNPDSELVLKGFWEKGKYMGKYDKPYVVHTLTNNITDVSVRQLKKSGSEITINVKCITGGASNAMNEHLPKARLVDIQQVEGRFEQQVADESASPVSNKYTLRNITYPFYAILSFETKNDTKFDIERVGIEFLDGSNWYVQVNIDN